MTVVNVETGEITEPLSAMEASALTHAEATIEQGLKSFVEVGEALAKVRDERLYRVDHSTFEAYCQGRWGMDRRNANRTIEAAEIVSGLGSIDPTAPAPANIGQARELSGLPTTEAAEIMQRASSGGKVTAGAIKAARTEVIADHTAKAVEDFPELAHHVETGRPADAVRLATALRGYDDIERERRRDILAKSIEADKRRAVVVAKDGPADWNNVDVAAKLFNLCNSASQAITSLQGVPTVKAAAGEVDPMTARMWREQFAALAKTCADLEAACIPTLRRIK